MGLDFRVRYSGLRWVIASEMGAFPWRCWRAAGRARMETGNERAAVLPAGKVWHCIIGCWCWAVCVVVVCPVGALQCIAWL